LVYPKSNLYARKEYLVMLQVQIGDTALNFGLIIIDMQNGFVSSGGSYDKLGMNIKDYQKIIPTIRDLISFCKK
jgi:ureidoacrylate peracid hydrolase